MTFSEEQIVTNEDWQKRHKGHEIVDDIDRYPLCEGKAEKRMHWWHCKTCDKRHLNKMETVEIDLGQCVKHGCINPAEVVEESDDCPGNALCHAHRTNESL